MALVLDNQQVARSCGDTYLVNLIGDVVDSSIILPNRNNSRDPTSEGSSVATGESTTSSSQATSVTSQRFRVARWLQSPAAGLLCVRMFNELCGNGDTHAAYLVARLLLMAFDRRYDLVFIEWKHPGLIYKIQFLGNMC